MEGQHFVLHAAVSSRPAPRPRSVAGRPPYMPQAFQDWKAALAAELALSWRRVHPRKLRTLAEPVAVQIYLSRGGITVWIDPSPDTTRDGLRGDLDNHAKAVLDALVASGIIGDDAQVHRLGVAFAPEPPDG